MSSHTFTRRSFLATAAAAPVALAAKKHPPIGLELYSIRQVLPRDLKGPDFLAKLGDVAKMGYAGVEIYGPYFDSWTPDWAKEVRKQLDGVGMKCFSTHNGPNAFAPAGIDKAIELNSILGSKFIVMASAGRVVGLDGWKKVAETLNQGADKMASAKIRAGYHNHQAEFKPLDGTRPIEVLAKNTTKKVMLQLDVGTCVEVGDDPVAWINQNPGRINCVHCKDWSKEKGYEVLFGDGAAPWKQIFQAAEKKGGVEYYLIEQEGYSLPPLETVAKCLENIKKIHG